jgi:hypothetical protein
MTAVNDKETAYTRGHGVAGGVRCTYPSCRFNSLGESPPYVVWDGVLDLDLFYTKVPPIVKLAMQEHFDRNQQANKYICWDYFFHPECAAEWGMHLISNAIKADPDVGRILTGRHSTKENSHAIR